jgi:hypothetical protein
MSASVTFPASGGRRSASRLCHLSSYSGGQRLRAHCAALVVKTAKRLIAAATANGTAAPPLPARARLAGV